MFLSPTAAFVIGWLWVSMPSENGGAEAAQRIGGTMGTSCRVGLIVLFSAVASASKFVTANLSLRHGLLELLSSVENLQRSRL